MARFYSLTIVLIFYLTAVTGIMAGNYSNSALSKPKLDGGHKCLGKEAEMRFIKLLHRTWLPIWNIISSNVKVAANANNHFTFKLYQLLSRERENTFYSPFSISSAFALVHASASGKSKSEVATVFGFKEINRYFDVSLGLFYQVVDAKSTQQTYFQTANKIWADLRLGVSKTFCDKLQLFYGGTITSVDFRQNAEGSRRKINSWIKEKTQEKITDALTPGSIDGLTDFVVTNAIYFKGSWKEAFDPRLTRKAKFFVNPEKFVHVDMMQKRGFYMHTFDELLSCDVIEIPYSCEKFSMLLFVPKSGASIERMEALLVRKGIERVLQTLTRTQMTLRLPKFQLSSSYDLVPSLRALGISTIFSKNADFSGLTGLKRGLSVHKVIHKAFIAVNEKGSVATAVTATIRGRSLLDSLKVNRPFIFLIRDRETSTILFFGKISNPLDF